MMTDFGPPRVIDALAQPEAASQAVAAITRPDEVQVPPPPDTFVTLPGGLMVGGECRDQAEIREMNGEDEEALARLGVVTVTNQFDLLLKRCLVSLNGRPVEPIETSSLLIGDRETLLVAIRQATYGNDVEVRLRCQSCNRDVDVAIELDKDIPTKEMKDKTKREFTIKLRKGEALFRLVTGADQREAVGKGDQTVPEQNTTLLSRCLKSINGNPVVGKEAVLRMGSQDRQKIIEKMVAEQPGPQWNDIKVPCTWCSQEIPMTMTPADIFRL